MRVKGSLHVDRNLSATTIYSGSTNLYSVFQVIGGSQTTVQGGINTFTGGTSSLPTVNVTSATLNNLVTSGTSRHTSLSATTLSGATIYSGSTNLGNLFVPMSLSGLTYSMAFGSIDIAIAGGTMLHPYGVSTYSNQMCIILSDNVNLTQASLVMGDHSAAAASTFTLSIREVILTTGGTGSPFTSGSGTVKKTLTYSTAGVQAIAFYKNVYEKNLSIPFSAGNAVIVACTTNAFATVSDAVVQLMFTTR